MGEARNRVKHGADPGRQSGSTTLIPVASRSDASSLIVERRRVVTSGCRSTSLS